MSTSLAERLHEQDDTEALHARWGFARDPRARDALVERYQGLVRQLASRYKASAEDFDDLIQVGNVGLLNALERFDADRGIPFRAFAIPTILGELRRYFRDTRWAVHMPRGLQERFLLVERAQGELSGRLGRSPRPADVAARLGLSEEEVLEAYAVREGYDALSLDRPQGTTDEDDNPSLLDTLGADESRYELV